jgi:hypothetical protein
LNEDAPEIRPTPERLAKAGDDVLEFISDTGRRSLRMKDSPLDRLAFGNKPKITGPQYQAGLRFYEDAYMAGMMPSGVINPAKERVDGGNFMNMSDAKVAALTRFEHALRILPFEYFHIAESVVIHETPLAEYAERFRRHKERRTRAAVALEFLCKALDALDKHYSPPRGDRGIRSAINDGYRPIIPPQKTPY